VDTLDEVACKYICLLTGKGYSTLKAMVQFDWKKVFRVPLQKPPRRATQERVEGPARPDVVATIPRIEIA